MSMITAPHGGSLEQPPPAPSTCTTCRDPLEIHAATGQLVCRFCGKADEVRDDPFADQGDPSPAKACMRCVKYTHESPPRDGRLGLADTLESLAEQNLAEGSRDNDIRKLQMADAFRRAAGYLRELAEASAAIPTLWGRVI